MTATLSPRTSSLSDASALQFLRLAAWPVAVCGVLIALGFAFALRGQGIEKREVLTPPYSCNIPDVPGAA